MAVTERSQIMTDDALKVWLHQSVRVRLKRGSVRVGRLERTKATGKYHVLRDGPEGANPGVQWRDATGVGDEFAADDVVNIENASSGMT
jgi:hypothetical protein